MPDVIAFIGCAFGEIIERGWSGNGTAEMQKASSWLAFF